MAKRKGEALVYEVEQKLEKKLTRRQVRWVQRHPDKVRKAIGEANQRGEIDDEVSACQAFGVVPSPYIVDQPEDPQFDPASILAIVAIIEKVLPLIARLINAIRGWRNG